MSQRSKEGRGFVAGGKRTDTDLINLNADQLSFVRDPVTGQSINLPAKFNPQSIEAQLQTIRSSPNLVSVFINALRSKFRAAQETQVINLMEQKIKAAQGGVTAQTELLRLQREYLLAVERLKTIPDDLKIEELHREDQKEALRLSIAQKAKTREALQSRSGVEQTSRTEELRKIEENITHRIKKDVLRTTLETKRSLILDEEKEKVKKEATDAILKRHGAEKIEDLSLEGFQELKKQLETIEDSFENAKAGAID
jgi:hypothetical protein